MSFERDFKWSAEALPLVVWPAVRGLCGGGELVLVEKTSTCLADVLDKASGVDAIQVLDDGVRAIASRAQKDCGLRTFTIRYWRESTGFDTEYKKRMVALHDNRELLYPGIMIHAYLDEMGVLQAAAVARTKDVFYLVDPTRQRQAPGGEKFIWLEWSKLIDHGFWICIWDHGQEIVYNG